MGKPISERMRRGSWWLEQLAHWGVGLAVSAGVAAGLGYGADWLAWGAAPMGVAVSLVAASTRELLQNWNDAPEVGSLEDAVLDLTFWGLGAACGPLALIWA